MNVTQSRFATLTTRWGSEHKLFELVGAGGGRRRRGFCLLRRQFAVRRLIFRWRENSSKFPMKNNLFALGVPAKSSFYYCSNPSQKYVSISHPSVFPLVCFFCEKFLCRGISAFCDRRSPHSVFFYPLSSCKGFWVIPPFFQQQQQLPHVFQMRAPPDDFVGDFAIMKASFVLEGKCDKPMRAYVHTHMSHRRAKCTHRKPRG